MTAALIFPIGHYAGRFYPGPGEPLKYHRLRIGDRPVKLFTERELDVWRLAHGIPDRLEETPWTREELLDEAPSSAGIVEELLADGILAEVPTGGPEAVEFARGHRLEPLLVGVGLSDDAAGYEIGLSGQPVLVTSWFGYQLWQLGHLPPTLWEACEMFAESSDITTDTGAMLTRVLASLHVLLARHAAYIDVVPPR